MPHRAPNGAQGNYLRFTINIGPLGGRFWPFREYSTGALDFSRLFQTFPDFSRLLQTSPDFSRLPQTSRDFFFDHPTLPSV